MIPLITNDLLHSTGLLSQAPDLRAVCLAVFTVHCSDSVLLAKNKESPVNMYVAQKAAVFVVYDQGGNGFIKHRENLRHICCFVCGMMLLLA